MFLGEIPYLTASKTQKRGSDGGMVVALNNRHEDTR
jgi:hypothetical protein